MAVFVPPMRGHVNPALAIVADLVGRGHDVACWLPAGFRDEVVSTGATWFGLPEVPPDPRLPAGGTDPVDYALLPVRLMAAAVTVVPAVLAQVAAFDPELVLYDVLCPWGRVIAQLRADPASPGRRTAQLCTSYAANQTFSIFDSAHQRLVPRIPEAAAVFADDTARIAADHGTPLLTFAELFFRPEPLTLVCVPRVFHPSGDSFDHRYAFVGLCAPVADPVDVPLLDGRPLVHVSLGTTFRAWPAFPELVAAAFADGRYQVALSSPPVPKPVAAQLVSLGAVVADRLPQVDLLRHAAVCVSHGGMNTTLESLAAAVPLVVLPAVSEQMVTADRIEDLGVGAALDRDRVTPQSLRRAVDRVATAGGYRPRVAAMRAAIDEAGGAVAAGAAVDLICRV